MNVPEQVRGLVDRHLRTSDESAPELIDKLYLTGSVALGDYRPGSSDIDFLAVTSRPVHPADITTLAAIHAAMPATPHYDGVYLDQAAFAATVDDRQIVPHVVNGVFRSDRPCGELNPVLWLTLSRYGIAMREPDSTDPRPKMDPERLRRWNLDNLKEYWQPLAGQIRQELSHLADDAVVDPVGMAWAVLGPARLHYTLATGDVTSKSGAGRYAIREFTAWAGLVERALARRDGRDRVDFVAREASATAAMIDAVVEDAWRRWG